MSEPAEQTETLRTSRNAIKIINQADRRPLATGRTPSGRTGQPQNATYDSGAVRFVDQCHVAAPNARSGAPTQAQSRTKTNERRAAVRYSIARTTERLQAGSHASI